jgi:hypothetical protein
VARSPRLPEHIREALSVIEPSRDGELGYFPCRTALRGGQIIDTVYIVPEKPYLKYWVVYPEDARAKSWIRVEDIAQVKTAPHGCRPVSQMNCIGMARLAWAIPFSLWSS